MLRACGSGWEFMDPCFPPQPGCFPLSLFLNISLCLTQPSCSPASEPMGFRGICPHFFLIFKCLDTGRAETETKT
jgi:hypothetical protein